MHTEAHTQARLSLTCQEHGLATKAGGSHCWNWERVGLSQALTEAQAGLDLTAVLWPLPSSAIAPGWLGAVCHRELELYKSVAKCWPLS